MRSQSLMVVFLITQLAACATLPKSAPALDPSKPVAVRSDIQVDNNPTGNDLVTKLHEFRQKTMRGFRIFGDKARPVYVDGVREYHHWWCANSPDAKQKLNDLINEHCRDVLDGNWDGQWCRSKQDEPLFQVKFDGAPFKDKSGHLPDCLNDPLITIQAATSERAQNEDSWEFKSRMRGFTSHIQQDETVHRQKAERMYQEQEIKAELDSNANYIMTHGVGMQVCKKSTTNDIALTYVGNVEQIAEGRIKVNVSKAVLAGSNRIMTGFSPTTVWEVAQAWYPCQ